MPVVLTASEMLTRAAEDSGPVEFARIATLKASTAIAIRGLNPDRKAVMTAFGGYC
jgi:hypothetical protein